MCGSQTDKCPPELKPTCLVVVVLLVRCSYGSICGCGVLLSLVSFPQIQPSEGAAAQTPLAANTGVLARPSAQAGVRVGDRDRDSCARGHSAGGHSCAHAPCVRLTSVTVSESMLRSGSCSSAMHCSHWNKTNDSTQAKITLPVLIRHGFPSILQLSVCYAPPP